MTARNLAVAASFVLVFLAGMYVRTLTEPHVVVNGPPPCSYYVSEKACFKAQRAWLREMQKKR